jgi:hypothetical protein
MEAAISKTRFLPSSIQQVYHFRFIFAYQRTLGLQRQLEEGCRVLTPSQRHTPCW